MFQILFNNLKWVITKSNADDHKSAGWGLGINNTKQTIELFKELVCHHFLYRLGYPSLTPFILGVLHHLALHSTNKKTVVYAESVMHFTGWALSWCQPLHNDATSTKVDICSRLDPHGLCVWWGLQIPWIPRYSYFFFTAEYSSYQWPLKIF